MARYDFHNALLKGAKQERDRFKQERDQLLEAIEAHRESLTFYCNKCGFFGAEGDLAVPGDPSKGLIHDSCDYLAGASPRDTDLYSIADRVRGEG